MTLRELRKAAGLKQSELAECSGVGRRTIIHIERGEHNPRYATRERLLRVLVSHFLGNPPYFLAASVSNHEEIFGPLPLFGRAAIKARAASA